MDNLIFISAQPDQVYFHWQVELYMYQFSKHGIQDKCYAIFGYTGDSPSEYIVNLSKKYNIRWYKYENTNSSYVPIIRPTILKHFFAEYPHLGKNVFYHDSDIFLVKLPNFNILLDDDIGYLSDTVSYIGYDYIKSCCKRYQSKYPDLPEDDLFVKMCKCVGISEELVKENEKNSGGAQYLLKNIDSTFWKNVEVSCNKLYAMLSQYESSYPIDHHVQSWTTDMWCVLWEYLKLGNKVEVHSELDFSWATDNIEQYHKKNIFHLAGITSDVKNVFYKGEYIQCNIFSEYAKNPNMFNHVSPKSATIKYVNMIKEYLTSDKTQFIIDTGKHYDDTYYQDMTKQISERDVWRSENGKFIIFWNYTSWILTGTEYENELTEESGGYASGSAFEPYDAIW